jgi:hypothetical protein
MTLTQGIKEHKKGRLAFRSATEKDAFEISHLPTARLRGALPTEKRIKVLMIALDHLEQNHVIANAGLVRKRLQQLCHRNNTAVTILFEPGKKDFSEWDLNAEGCVIDCRPCQAFAWCGNYVMNFEKLKVGGKVAIFTHDSGKLAMNYRIKALVYGPAAGLLKYPEHKPNASLMHDGRGKQ